MPKKPVSDVEQGLIDLIKTTGKHKNYELIEYVNDVNRDYTEVLMEVNIDGEMDTAYTYGNERLALERFTGWTGYYTNDPRGSVTGVTDSEGTLWKSYRYGPTGDITFGKPEYNNVHSYNAEDYNPNLEFQYLRARYYDVERGDFLTEDTYLGDITDPLTLNRYNYVKSSALNYVDPSGMRSVLKELPIQASKKQKNNNKPKNENLNDIKDKKQSFVESRGQNNLSNWMSRAKESEKVKKCQAFDVEVKQMGMAMVLNPTTITTYEEFLAWCLALSQVDTSAPGLADIAAGVILVGGSLYYVKVGMDSATGENRYAITGEQGYPVANPSEATKAKGESGAEGEMTKGKSRAPAEGEPGSTYDQVDDKGEVMSETKYGDNRKPEYRDDLKGRPHYDKKTGQYLDQHRHVFEYNDKGQPIGEVVIPIPKK
ncbi:RHS repeat domain-containing protein [Lacrimispora sp.]|uniref:RHS repeat domain-containing protein n=1 Tax=Lacrimispora sp. TaxID=2719234 RepID=UPI0028615C43|nr:RHS repeat-associated core domain-containing protein [Lacrimispora sp.]MDR7814699.1 RHS repeat-associated core domain-containing protein [Lacrimispora sp.]